MKLATLIRRFRVFAGRIGRHLQVSPIRQLHRYDLHVGMSRAGPDAWDDILYWKTIPFGSVVMLTKQMNSIDE